MGYRLISRIIGIINLILSSIAALLVLIAIVVLSLMGGEMIKRWKDAGADEHSLPPNKEILKDAATDSSLILGIMLLVCVLVLLVLFLHILAAWKLIKGTEEFTSPKDGLRYCRIWRGITIFFVVVQMLPLIFIFTGKVGFSMLVPFLIPPGIYIVTLCVVQQHMNRLAQNAFSYPNDEMVHF